MSSASYPPDLPKQLAEHLRRLYPEESARLRTDPLKSIRLDDLDFFARQLGFPFHAGQRRAWDSPKRIILALAGWQAGKTVIGPPWLTREIQRCGPGDYLVASPSYPLMTKKVLPEFLRLFKRRLQLGDYVGGAKNVFTFSDDGCRRLFGRVPDAPTQVFFGHAADPDSLESATHKAAWLDEAGQKKFRMASYEAVLGRLSIAQGRVLVTSRPYDLGWLKQLLYDPWEAAKGRHPSIDVVNFRSIDNPAFPREEYDRARESMPGWKFRMNYEGVFTRPAGLIYDCFDKAAHTLPRFKLPDGWPRYGGLDFGGVNTAAVFAAKDPGNGNVYLYREYKAGGRTAKEHADKLKAGEPSRPQFAGGSKSEGQWRDEFRAAGLPVREPTVSAVELGIDKVTAWIKSGKLFVFDDLHGLLDELGSYSREVDDFGQPTEEIDDKSSYHYCDSIRYMLSWLSMSGPATFGTGSPGMMAGAPEGVFRQ